MSEHIKVKWPFLAEGKKKKTEKLFTPEITLGVKFTLFINHLYLTKFKVDNIV